MIVVDTSALTAIFRNEPVGAEIERILANSLRSLVPVSCVLEFALLRRMGPARFDWLNFALSRVNVETVGIEPADKDHAVEAARRDGKGSGHPAQLNFGDCLSYAVARSRDLPLLYVGEDFRHTDIQSVL